MVRWSWRNSSRTAALVRSLSEPFHGWVLGRYKRRNVLRLVLVAKPLYEAVTKDLKDVETLRQAASAVDGINRLIVFSEYECTRGGGCFVVDFARRIELPRVFTKLLLGGALSVGRGGGSLLDEVVGLAERWLGVVSWRWGVRYRLW